MVNRCICSNISFADVKIIAKNKNLTTVDELRLNEVCCRHCELCRPYVEEMLETGETSFSPDLILKRKVTGRN